MKDVMKARYVIVADWGWGQQTTILYEKTSASALAIGRDLERQGAAVLVAKMLAESSEFQIEGEKP